MPRPTLVFWRLGTVAGVVTFLNAVEACDLTDVTLLLQVFFRGVDGVVASSRGFFWFLSFSEPLLLVSPVFLVLLILLQGLPRIGMDGLCVFGFGLLRAGLLCSRFLSLHL